MTEADDKIKEIDKKIIEIDNKIKNKDSEILGHYRVEINPAKGNKLRPKLSWDKKDDDATVKDVLVETGMFLAPISEKSALVAEKSSLITEKLTLSVNKLYESSKALERFTFILIGLTEILAFIAGIELVKDFIPSYAVAILGFAILAFILYAMYTLTKSGKVIISKN